MNRTTLYSVHQALNAKFISFSNFEMPVWYHSIKMEHEAVRKKAGVFDISHMGLYRISGQKSVEFLSYLSCNVVPSQPKSVYSMFLNKNGGILDDVMISWYQDGFYVVVNACNHQKIESWLNQHRMPDVTITSLNKTHNFIALQGPDVVQLMSSLFQIDPLLKSMSVIQHVWQGHSLILFKSGYTGEYGFECLVPHAASEALWKLFIDHGVTPCGLGCRDTLRIEAGLPLYGQELSEDIHPLMTRYDWVIKWDHEFIGKDALKGLVATQTTVGLIMQDRVIPRTGCKILQGGSITSGTLSFLLNQPIAMAIVPLSLSKIGTLLDVEVRGMPYSAKVVSLPFLT